MKTLSPKVLPVTRILLHYCNSNNGRYTTKVEDMLTTTLSKKTRELAIERVTDETEKRFDFYQITDGLLIVRLAVLKENPDSIIPYQYWNDEYETRVRLVRFNDEGFPYASAQDEFYQKEFCFWVYKWLQYVNQIHQLA